MARARQIAVCRTCARRLPRYASHDLANASSSSPARGNCRDPFAPSASRRRRDCGQAFHWRRRVPVGHHGECSASELPIQHQRMRLCSLSRVLDLLVMTPQVQGHRSEEFVLIRLTIIPLMFRTSELCFCVAQSHGTVVVRSFRSEEGYRYILYPTLPVRGAVMQVQWPLGQGRPHLRFADYPSK